MEKKFCGTVLETALWSQVKAAAAAEGKAISAWVAEALRAALMRKRRTAA